MEGLHIRYIRRYMTVYDVANTEYLNQKKGNHRSAGGWRGATYDSPASPNSVPAVMSPNL